MSRVAFLLPDFRIGGAERVALTLIQAFVERGIQVDLVLLNPEGRLLNELPPEVRLVPLSVKRIRDAIRPFAKYLRERRPDAVEASMWPLTLVPIIARRLAGTATRIVISDHGIHSEAYADHGPLHRLLLRKTIGLLYPRADARVAVSAGVADDLVKLGGLKRDSITVLHNPIALQQSRGGLHDVDWGGEGKRILAVGSLKPVKNYPLLLSAFAKLIKLRPSRLIIVGEGQQRDQLGSLATALGIAEHVEMPGAVADPSPYYASADILVLSSDNEGFGNVLIEAMQQGLTVVSTDCPTGPREILDGGRFGYLTPCGDAEALAHAIGRACDEPLPAELQRQRAYELSGPHIIDQYAELMLQGLGR